MMLEKLLIPRPSLSFFSSVRFCAKFICLTIVLCVVCTSAQAASPAAAHREKAEFFFFHGDTYKAIDEYEESLKFENGDWQTHLSLASLYIRTDDLAQAKKHLNAVINLRPQDRDARILLSQIHSKEGNEQSAARELEAVLALGRDSGLLHSLLGFALLKSGELKKAEEQFRAAIGGKDNASAMTGLSLTLLRQDRLSEARETIDKCIASNDGDADMHKIRGDILALENKSDEAATEYKTALRLRPDFPSAMLAQGNLYFAKGDLEHAITLFRKAAACNTNEPQYYYALAMALEKSGKLTDAASEYNNGAFLEKDKLLASKMQGHAQKLRALSRAGSLNLQGATNEQAHEISLGALKRLTPEEVFGINYERLIDRPTAASRSKFDAAKAMPLPSLRSLKSVPSINLELRPNKSAEQRKGNSIK